MADNYLENKYEEFKAQQLARKSAARKVVYRTHPDCIEVNFPPRRVFVTGGANGIGRAIVAAFRKANCQVAFCDIDSKAGNATAQQLGARFYPLDVTDTSALERDFGFKPSTSLREGLRAFARWYKEYYG